MSTIIDNYSEYRVKAMHITYYYESEHRIVFQFKMTILNKLSTFLALCCLFVTLDSIT